MVQGSDACTGFGHSLDPLLRQPGQHALMHSRRTEREPALAVVWVGEERILEAVEGAAPSDGVHKLRLEPRVGDSLNKVLHVAVSFTRVGRGDGDIALTVALLDSMCLIERLVHPCGEIALLERGGKCIVLDLAQVFAPLRAADK